MQNLKSFVFSAWVSGQATDALRERCCISWKAPEDAEGMKGVNFYFSRPEIESLVSGKTYTAADGYYKLELCGDLWTFYHFELPSRSEGEAKVPYRRVTLPRFVIEMLLRQARKIWAAQATVPYDDQYRLPRVEIELTAKQRERYVRMYGQATGRVNVDVDERASESFARDSAESKVFAERIEYLSRIAKNTTYAYCDTAVLKVFKDGDSYFWNALTPSGRSTLHGGLIRREAGDWSVHT